MPGPTVKTKQPKTQFAESVTGYRAGLDTPTGQVLVTGPRRPSAGYPSNTRTLAPGGELKVMAQNRTPQPSAKKRTGPTAPRFDPRINGLGRTIVPNSGISLGNMNRGA